MERISIAVASVLEGGGVEVEMEGLQLALASTDEEALVFYDALEASGAVSSLCQTMTDRLTMDLSLSDFAFDCPTPDPPSGANPEACVKDTEHGPVELLHKALQRTLQSLVIAVRNTQISLRGPQSTQSLILRLPSLDAYQLTGDHAYSIEIGEGAELCLAVGSVQHTVLSSPSCNSVHLQAGHTRVEASSVKAELVIRDLYLLKEFARIYKQNNTQKAARDPSSLSLDIKEMRLLLGSEEASHEAIAKEIAISLASLFSMTCATLQIHDRNSNKETLSLDSIHAVVPLTTGTTGTPLLKVHHMRGANDMTTLLAVLQDFYRVVWGSSVMGKIPFPSEPVKRTLRVENIDLAGLAVWGRQVNGSFSGLELHSEDRQSVLHLQQGTLQIDSIVAKAHRLSLFRSLRSPPSSAAAADIEWPFSSVTMTIEGSQFIPTISNPEDYFLLRAKTIEACTDHWHLSVEEIDLDSSLAHILALYAGLPIPESHTRNTFEDSKFPRPGLCLTSSLSRVRMREPDVGIYVECNALELLINLKSRGGWSCDLRGDLLEVFLNKESSEEHNPALAQKALTTSLDPHHKPLVVTVLAGEDKGIQCSVLLAGMTFSVPLFSERLGVVIGHIQSLVPLQSPEKDPASNAAPSINVQLQRCSFCGCLPEKYQLEISPHVIYLDNVRLLTGARGAGQQMFLQKGEVFIAPSRLVVRTVSGLFDEGHNYWEEQNYEAISRFDFVQVRFLSAGEGKIVIVLEDHSMTVDLYKDSMQILFKIIQKYLQLLRERRLSHVDGHEGDDGNNVREEPASLSMAESDLEDKRLETEPDLGGLFLQHLYGEKLSFDQDFYAFTSAFNTLEVDAMDPMDAGDEELRGLFEIPIVPQQTENTTTSESKDEEVKLRFFEQEGLQYEEDYFSVPMEGVSNGNPTFPFSGDNQDTLARLILRLRDFSVRIRLIAGQQWHPNRRNQIIPASAVKETESILDRSLSSSMRTRSHLSSPASSRWSCLMGVSRTAPKMMLSTTDSVQVSLQGINAEFEWSDPFPESMPNAPDSVLVGVRMSVGELAIVDHVRASRWKSLLGRRHRKSEQGCKPMLRISVKAEFVERCGQECEPLALPEDHLEYNVKIEVEPLRLHVDQDTMLHVVSFFQAPLLKWNSDPNEETVAPLFIQSLHLSDVSLRIDYKPKRLDVKKMIGGKYIELLNVFDLEDAELFLPAVKLRGLSGLGDVGGELMRALLPHVKNTQLSRMLGGITPVRTVMNVGGGMVDLIVLPFEQYKRKGRLVAGLKRGAFSFLQATVLETARVGKKLAVGAQTILEHADDIVEGHGGVSATRVDEKSAERHLGIASTSKYSAPPSDVAEGALAAYSGLRSTLNQAAHTVVAIPVQVYEQQGAGGAAKAVLRAVPVAVLRTMIGASEALGKAMMGVEGSLDEMHGIEIKQKYKTRLDRYTHDPLDGASVDDSSLGSSFPAQL